MGGAVAVVEMDTPTLPVLLSLWDLQVRKVIVD